MRRWRSGWMEPFLGGTLAGKYSSSPKADSEAPASAWSPLPLKGLSRFFSGSSRLVSSWICFNSCRVEQPDKKPGLFCTAVRRGRRPRAAFRPNRRHFERRPARNGAVSRPAPSALLRVGAILRLGSASPARARGFVRTMAWLHCLRAPRRPGAVWAAGPCYGRGHQPRRAPGPGPRAGGAGTGPRSGGLRGLGRCCGPGAWPLRAIDPARPSHRRRRRARRRRPEARRALL